MADTGEHGLGASELSGWLGFDGFTRYREGLSQCSLQRLLPRGRGELKWYHGGISSLSD